MSSEASVLVRSFPGSGISACSQRVLRDEAGAPVIGSFPDTQSLGSFSVLSAISISFAGNAQPDFLFRLRSFRVPKAHADR